MKYENETCNNYLISARYLYIQLYTYTIQWAIHHNNNLHIICKSNKKKFKIQQTTQTKTCKLHFIKKINVNGKFHLHKKAYII